MISMYNFVFRVLFDVLDNLLRWQINYAILLQLDEWT